MRILLVAVVLALAGCGSDRCPAAPETGCRYEVRGACAVFDPADPLQGLEDIDVPAHLERGIAEAAEIWEVDPDTVVRGVTIVLRQDPTWIDGALVLGAASASCHTIYLSNGVSPRGGVFPGCIELMLPHEIGHLVLPDDEAHQDPRWAVVDWAGERLCGE